MRNGAEERELQQPLRNSEDLPPDPPKRGGTTWVSLLVLLLVTVIMAAYQLATKYALSNTKARLGEGVVRGRRHAV